MENHDEKSDTNRTVTCTNGVCILDPEFILVKHNTSDVDCPRCDMDLTTTNCCKSDCKCPCAVNSDCKCATSANICNSDCKCATVPN